MIGPHAGWISVNDFLPEAGVDVLVVDDKGAMHVKGLRAITTSIANRKRGWSGRVYTHWMPLPNLPLIDRTEIK